ncbi:hypothetical protein [Acinetobacter sp.]|jgi:hypothetical protein|uniref:hypothetical protein n=1 Tax=Acinetobacter sp. TaxID=472 RepID=UPI0035B44610
MDFILFLLFAGIIFIISNKPFKRAKAHAQAGRHQPIPNRAPQNIPQQDSVQHNQPKPPAHRQPAVDSALHSPSRPSAPVLLGIEITPIQQRRLGKNDPSVLAANRAKQRYAHSGAPSFLDKIGQQIEKAAQQMDAAAQPQKSSGKEFKKEDLNKLFNNLFSNKK